MRAAIPEDFQAHCPIERRFKIAARVCAMLCNGDIQAGDITAVRDQLLSEGVVTSLGMRDGCVRGVSDANHAYARRRW